MAEWWSCMAKAYCRGYFSGKVSWLPIDPRKPWIFPPWTIKYRISIFDIDVTSYGTCFRFLLIIILTNTTGICIMHKVPISIPVYVCVCVVCVCVQFEWSWILTIGVDTCSLAVRSISYNGGNCWSVSGDQW